MQKQKQSIVKTPFVYSFYLHQPFSNAITFIYYLLILLNSDDIY